MTDYGIYATQALGVYIGILLGNLAIKQKPSYLALLAGSSSPAPGRLWPFFFFQVCFFIRFQSTRQARLQEARRQRLEGEHFPIYQQHIHEHSLI